MKLGNGDLGEPRDIYAEHYPWGTGSLTLAACWFCLGPASQSVSNIVLPNPAAEWRAYSNPRMTGIRDNWGTD